MKQVLQNFKTGKTELIEIPTPKAKFGNIIIQTKASLISAGTERILVEFGKAGYLERAKSQPDKVKQVIDKVKTDGLLTTLESVKSKLDQPIPMGYANAGVIMEIGKGVSGFQVGDRVVSNGQHAEIVSVPKNLCARIPNNVSDNEAAFTVPAAIGLQGIRLAKPTLGETFVVIGLGLIGLLTAQLLKAHGCNVLGIDLDKEKLKVAMSFGIEICDLSKGENPVEAGLEYSHGRGVDGVLITASTKSNDPVQQAAMMCRKRGRIIQVGNTGLELKRQEFYDKELSLQVSCSYGPGRYDADYEDKGQDYPLAYTRWTEQRNFEAVLDMMSGKKLDVTPLITHRFSFDKAEAAYETLTNENTAIGILLEYCNQEENIKDRKELYSIELKPGIESRSPGTPVIAFIGAGNFASRVLIPAFKESGAKLHTIVSSGGVTAVHHGKRQGFNHAASDISCVYSSNEINTLVIATRHNTHADLVIKSLKAGKNVFVEKPLCLNQDELKEIFSTYQSLITNNQSPILMIGFNRRFAPHIIKMKSLLDIKKSPKSFIITVNAGAIPSDHWAQDPDVGGGRIIGEGCHFIDLMRFLAGSPINSWHAQCMGNDNLKDKVIITLQFEDGSFGSIHYLANGSKRFPKERIEVFCGGGILQLDNFREMKGYDWPGFNKMKQWKQDKGHQAGAKAFLDAIYNNLPSPIPFNEIIEVSRVTIEIAKSL